MMTQTAIRDKILEIKDLKKMKSELEDMIKAAEDEIKQEMTELQVDDVNFGEFHVIWKPVVTQKFDATAFKKASPELASRFMIASTSRPFKIY